MSPRYSFWGAAQRTTLLAALLLATAGCGSDAPEPAPRPTPVRVAAVETAALTADIRAIGVVAPVDELRLSFKTGGMVESVEVTQGERVSGGQRLAALALDEVRASASQARSQFEKAERDLERGEALLRDEVATREQVEDLRTARDVARAALSAADFNARLAHIVAPMDGVVLRRLAEPGELVAAGQPVLLLGNTEDGWILRAVLSDRDRVRVAIGAVGRVTLDAFPGHGLRATVTELAAAADPATGTFEVKLALEPQGLQLVQGLVAKLTLPGQAGTAVPIVPIEALLEANGPTAVLFVVAAEGSGSVAQRVEVRLGHWVGTQVEVVEGLDAGARVVTEGAAYLRDGESVRVLDPA